MLDTQIGNISESEFCINFLKDESLDVSEKEIDFEGIKIDSEYIYSPLKERTFTLNFIGDIEESTEIDSIVSSLNASDTSSRMPQEEDPTETYEILSILKQNSPLVRKDLMSIPQKIIYKKLSLSGKVLYTRFHSEPVEGSISHLSATTRSIPPRVSNPIYKNNDCLHGINIQYSNPYIDNCTLTS